MADVLTVPDWLIDRVEVDENGCWLWTLSCSANGYGQWCWRENGRRFNRRAHREVYLRLVGPIPDGMVLDHLCRVRRCVRPSHLEPVVNAENLRRGAGQRPKPTCRRGHAWDAAPPFFVKGKRSCRVCKQERDREAGRRYRQRLLMRG